MRIPVFDIFTGKRQLPCIHKRFCIIADARLLNGTLTANDVIMNILLLLIVLILLFGGGGFYFGGPVVGGSGLGLVLLICLIIFLAGGFRGGRGRL